MANTIYNGTTDKPISDKDSDQFEIDAYIEGLGDFILECETPMTIAVQGDWGCGKTSMMNMVRSYIKQKDSNITEIWFNTWQFSQFNMGSQISTIFLENIITELTKKLPEDRQRTGNTLKFIIKSFRDLALINISGHIGGDTAAETTKSLLQPEMDFPEQLIKFKTAFSDLINEVSKYSSKRVIIFIDDLDRLQPSNAVELLEVLKNFVDHENCVFVLAIDTSVVFQGIREKYGKDISDEKAQSFFDKMIQLPFKMPVEKYNLDKTICDMMSLNEYPAEYYEYKNTTIKLIKYASDGNPRSIKRIINFYSLIDRVAKKRKVYDSLSEKATYISRQMILSLVCIQLNYESLYKFITKDISIKTIENFKSFKRIDVSDILNAYKGLTTWLTDLGAPTPLDNDVDIVDYTNIILTFIYACQDLFDCLDKTYTNKYNTIIQILSLSTIVQVNTNSNLLQSNTTNNLLQPNMNNNLLQSNTNITHINTDIKTTITRKTLSYDDTPTSYISRGRADEGLQYLINKNIYPPIYELEVHTNRFTKKRLSSELYDTYTNKLKHPLYQYITKNLTKVGFIIKDDDFIRFPGVPTTSDDSLFSIKIFWEYQVITITKLNQYLLSNQSKFWTSLEKTIQELSNKYNELTSVYGNTIFPPEFYQSIHTQTQNKGREETYYKGELPLCSKDMADIFIEFAINLACESTPEYFNSLYWPDNMNQTRENKSKDSSNSPADIDSQLNEIFARENYNRSKHLKLMT
jgi:Cdc6-like AAA superfamily ATPase